MFEKFCAKERNGRLRATKLSSFVRKASMFNKKKIYVIFITEATVRNCCTINQFKIYL